MMRLLLIRHGQTVDNVTRTIGTQYPGRPLSDEGVAQATSAATRLIAEEDIRLIGHSPLLRARQTADALTAVLGVPSVEVAGVEEITAGDLEGLPYAAGMGGYMGTMQQWWRNPAARIPGGESGVEFIARFDAGIEDATLNGDETVAVVSHEAAIRVWASLRAENLDEESSRAYGLDNVGVVVMTGSPSDGWVAESWAGIPL